MVQVAMMNDLNASWSNRNGGEVLVSFGPVQMTLSVDAVSELCRKLSAALAIPAKAARMAQVAPALELERVSDAAASITQPLSERRLQLARTYGDRSARWLVLREAIAAAETEMADVVAVRAGEGAILFTIYEARLLEGNLCVGPIGGRTDRVAKAGAR